MNIHLNPYDWKSIIPAVILLCALLMVVAKQGAATSDPIIQQRQSDRSSIESLFEVFRVDLATTDIAIMLDASRSMQSKYNDAREAAIRFISTLTDKENLHLRVFTDVVTSPLEGKGNEVAGQIDSFLPRTTLSGRGTDLGLAILKSLEFFERDGASNVQALLLLTDGLHQPPSDSPYSRDFDNDPNWLELRHRAHALCAKRLVMVYGFGVGNQTDIAVLRKVFPAQNVELAVGNSAGVTRVLEQIRDRLRRSQLRRLVEEELRDGRVEVLLKENSISGNISRFNEPIIIRNSYRHLPVDIEQVSMQPDGSASKELRCALEISPAKGSLLPGMELKGQFSGILSAVPSSFHIGKTEEHYRAAYHFVPILHFKHEAALREIVPDLARPRVETAALTIDLSITSGVSYSTITIAASGMVILVGMAAIGQKRREQLKKRIKARQSERSLLKGRLKIWDKRKDEPIGEGIDLGNYRNQKLDLAILDQDRLETIKADESQHLEIVARLSGSLAGASADDSESGKPEYRIEAVRGHKLSYRSREEMIEYSSALVLCDGDFLEIDGRWTLLYTNDSLRRRFEVESY